jgi:hypothetical protein
MLVIVQTCLILGFPAGAVWAARTGGARRLWLLAGACLFAVMGVALASAAPVFGNRLADRYGYANTALLALVLAGLTSGLPLVVATGTVQACESRVARNSALYVVGVVASLAAFLIGAFAAMYLIAALVEVLGGTA